MSIELILLAVNINLVAFSTFLGDIVGQVYALIVLTVAAAEAAIGLAILVAYLPQPRLDRGRRHQSDEGLSGACIRRSSSCRCSAPSSPAPIALVGARNRLPGEDPPPPHDDHAAPLVPEHVHARAVAGLRTPNCANATARGA